MQSYALALIIWEDFALADMTTDVPVYSLCEGIGAVVTIG